MNKIDLLRSIQILTLEETRDIIMPTAPQKDDGDEPKTRTADVHLMRLPDSTAAKKKAPYILHQLVTGKDGQASGDLPYASAVIRSIFCVYCGDEEEGALMLINLIERLRIRLLRQVVLDQRYQLDLEAGLEMMVYPEDMAPYYAGEMISTWKLPAIKREVNFYG